MAGLDLGLVSRSEREAGMARLELLRLAPWLEREPITLSALSMLDVNALSNALRAGGVMVPTFDPYAPGSRQLEPLELAAPLLLLLCGLQVSLAQPKG